jgi:hypothetical protein
MSGQNDDWGVKILLHDMEQELQDMGLTTAQVVAKMTELVEEFERQAPYGRERRLRIVDGGKRFD